MSDVQWHLAQVNIGRARGAITDPVMLGFVAHLEAHGPTPFAFSFAQPFDPEECAAARERTTQNDACPAI